MIAIGADGQKFKANLIEFDGGREAGWKSFSQTSEIPDGAKTFRVFLYLRYVKGTFDFDDIVVEFD